MTAAPITRTPPQLRRGTPAESRDENAKRIAKTCFESAKSSMGNGWAHISDELQWGLICAEIMEVIRSQDETISPASVLELGLAIYNHAGNLLYGNPLADKRRRK